MDFNFDELGDEAECPDIPSMGPEAFKGFGARLRAALDAQDYRDVDQAVAEALWVKNVPRERVRGVVKELLDLLSEIATRKQDGELLRGCAIAHALARFGMSLSLDRVASRPKEQGAHVALILGAAGTDAEEPSPQSRFYAARGLSTVAACRCLFPVAFERYQEAQLATELQECLRHDEGGAAGRVLVHLCGPHGHAMWCRVAGLWGQRQRPFHRLPALEACLAAVVFECGPPADVLPEEATAAKQGAEEAPEDEAEKGKPRLSLEDALRMQRELYAQFSKDEFMDRLEDLEESHKLGTPKFIGARNKLFLEVQAPIIAKYGFEGSHKGVMQMLAAAARWNGHPDYRRNVDRLNCLLGINAEGSSEHNRRVQAAQKEHLAAQEPKAESGDAIQYDGDATGMASCMDRCIRSLLLHHLPDVALGKVMLDIKPYVAGASTRGAFWLGDDYAMRTDSGQPLWGRAADWAAVDAATPGRVPRLFLYSRSDQVVAPETVEAHIRLAEKDATDAADVMREEVQGQHMRLWNASRPACERAALALLKRAGVLKE